MSASRLPPPPPPFGPPPQPHSPWRPPPKRGIAGFWERRSPRSKVGVAAVGILVAAVLVTPARTPAAPATPGLSAAPAGLVDVRPAATPTARPSGTAAIVTAPSLTPTAPSPTPTPTPAPTPTPKPTPFSMLVSDTVSVESDASAFRGNTGTYTWSAVSIGPSEVVVRWDARAGSTACRIRWVLAPEDADATGRTIRVASGERVRGSRIIDTSSISDASLRVTSTCPRWLLTMKEAPEPTPKPVARSTNCHPSYIGECLRRGAGDYDCAGGSGNGPNYVYGTVRVVGWDEFGLDRDNDGLGCE